MEQSCARAVDLGLPAIAFTEHFDLTRWRISSEALAQMPHSGHLVGDDQRFNPPAFDVEGYQAELARCRDLFPGVRILSGVEVGEPHWFAQDVGALLESGAFERVLGSLHSIESDGERWVVDDLRGPASAPGFDPEQQVHAYLAELLRMVNTSDAFAVLAHIDYPARDGLPIWRRSRSNVSRTSSARCSPRWRPRTALSRSTRDSPWMSRCSSGGATSAERTSRLAAMRTIRPRWLMALKTPRQWRAPTGSPRSRTTRRGTAGGVRPDKPQTRRALEAGVRAPI